MGCGPFVTKDKKGIEGFSTLVTTRWELWLRKLAGAFTHSANPYTAPFSPDVQLSWGVVDPRSALPPARESTP